MTLSMSSFVHDSFIINPLETDDCCNNTHDLILSRLRGMYGIQDQLSPGLDLTYLIVYKKWILKELLSDTQEQNFCVPRTVCTLNPCLTSFRALVCCIIHMLMIHSSISFTEKLSDIECCVSEIKLWMERWMMIGHNLSFSNLSKTLIRLQVCGTSVAVSSKIINLGGTFSQTLLIQTLSPRCAFIIREILLEFVVGFPM